MLDGVDIASAVHSHAVRRLQGIGQLDCGAGAGGPVSRYVVTAESTGRRDVQRVAVWRQRDAIRIAERVIHDGSGPLGRDPIDARLALRVAGRLKRRIREVDVTVNS